MSEPVENNEPPVCRLCTSTKAGQMQIFGNETGNKNLARKIKECLPIKVAEDDALSKTVCDGCLAKLEEFYRFRQVCIFAQFTLEQQRQDPDNPSPEPPKDDSLKDDSLKDDSLKDDLESAEDIVERLQAGGDGSALSITPVKPHADDTLKENNELSKMMTGSGALSITPVIHQSESSADDDSQWSPSIPTMPRIADPLPEDYVLMKEETFTLSDHGDILTRLHNYTDQYEFRDRTDSDERKKRRGVFKDADIMESQQAKRFVLPPMWDVFEKQPNRDVTHRRYVISKGSFPCSLCGSCVNFHQQQVIAHERLVVKDDRVPSFGDVQIHDVAFNNAQFNEKKLFPKVEIKEEIPEEIDLEQPEEEEEEVELELRMEEQNAIQGEILQDLRVNQFSPQSVGEVLHCPQCGKVFPRRSSWRRHMRTHYEGRSFVCPLCGKGFNRKEHLSRHMMSHTGGRPFRCETCFKPFTRKEHLSRHLACNRGCGGAGSQGTLEADTNVPRPHVCDICFQGFVRKEHMMRHRKRAHQQLYALPPPTQEDDDVRLYSCTLCPKRFTRKEHLKRHEHAHISRQEKEAARSPTHRAHFLADAKEVLDGPEQIEVEVNIGMLGEESDVDAEPSPNGNGKSGLQSADAKATTSSTTSEVDPENEELELDDEDLLRMQMNETMRQAREGSAVTMSPTPRCQVCHNTFTRKSHLVRHLRRFHPQVELAYAAAYSLGSGMPNSDDTVLQGHPGVDEEDDIDDENVNAVTRNGPVAYGATKSKGGQHPCTLCGKVFGRRYHLVRHRKTQHGVECSKTGRVGRPPKNPPLNPVELSALSMLTFFSCAACKSQFSTADEFKIHSCQNNNNNNSNGEGSSKSNPDEAQSVSQEKLLKTKEKPFDCSSCGESFEKQKELNKHVETHVQDLMKDMLWT